ncbi:MAG: hypothetical protein NTX24_00585 [Candidatus Pacearchaeota archaeon]|nr:hypothetical protein [Candidatus Pacearchaeota archaeon]
MVAPIVAAKAAKDIADKKEIKKAGGAFFKVLLSILLIIIILLLLFIASSMFFGGWGWNGSPFMTSPVYYNSYGSSPEKSVTTNYNYDPSSPYYYPWSGFSGEGCYWAYICPGVPPESCDNCTEDSQTCVNNSQCCSNCCKYSSGYGFKCVPEEQCAETCHEYLGACTNNSDCCSNCCRVNGECGFAQECSSCVQERGTCSNSSQCCYGLTCQDGTCEQECGNYLADCETNLDCCSGCCRTYGECGFAQECSSCVQERGTCSNSSQCCYGLTCQDGTCEQESQCLDLNVTCSRDNNTCCSGCCDYVLGGPGFVCLPENLCSNDCTLYGQYCKTGEDCCSGVCNANSTCGCLQGGYSCFGENSCCSPYSCINGMCNMPN